MLRCDGALGPGRARSAVAAAALLFALFALVAPARAQPLVVESAASGAPPLDAAIGAEVVKRLGFPAARAGAALAVEIDSRVGPAPRRLPAAALAELGERLERAQQDLWLSGKRVRRAVETVEDVRAQLADAPGSLAHEPAASELYYRVLLTLARAYQLAPRPRLADETMDEAARVFPDRPVDAARDGRALAELYRRVERARPAPAELRLDAGGAAAAWFADGRRLDGVRVSLPAGEHRLFAATARGDGRLHRIALERGGGALAVDAAFEAALETAEFVGFRFADGAEREKLEPRFARALAAALGAERVLVLARAGEGIALRLYRPDGVRAAAVPTADPAEVGRAAAALINGDKPPNPISASTVLNTKTPENKIFAKPADPVKPETSKPEISKPEISRSGTSRPELTRSAPEKPAPPWLDAAAWTGLGAGLLLAAFGGAALGWDGVGTCFATDSICPRQLDTHAVGGATLGAGGALALASTAYLLARREPRRLRAAALVAAAWGVALLGTGGALLPVEDYPLLFRVEGGALVKVTHSTRLGAGLALGAGAALVAAAAGLGAADLLGARARGLAIAPLTAAGASGFSLSCDF